MQGLKFILHKFIFACIDGVTDKFAVHINRIRSTTVQVGTRVAFILLNITKNCILIQRTVKEGYINI